jgi:pyruvate formate lyase activating enzyme
MAPRTCVNDFEVNFGDYVPLSTLDWPGKASVVFFLRDCPFRCPYCQNYSILNGYELVESSQIKQLMETSRPFVSSVVISGGEPLQQEQAVSGIAQMARDMGLLVGIHTNGVYADVLEGLIEKELVDGVFIDVKASLENADDYGRMIGYGSYPAVTISPADAVNNVQRSIKLAAENGLLQELRTTVLPGFMDSHGDIESIASSIAKCAGRDVAYFIQQGETEHSMDRNLRDLSPLSRDELLSLGYAATSFLNNVCIRTGKNGTEKITSDQSAV